MNGEPLRRNEFVRHENSVQQFEIAIKMNNIEKKNLSLPLYLVSHFFFIHSSDRSINFMNMYGSLLLNSYLLLWIELVLALHGWCCCCCCWHGIYTVEYGTIEFNKHHRLNILECPSTMFIIPNVALLMPVKTILPFVSFPFAAVVLHTLIEM